MIKKVSKAISILSILFAAFLGSAQVYAQNRNISGTVVDEGGEPVIGAGVVVVGQRTLGTTTDIDGTYKISVPAGVSLDSGRSSVLENLHRLNHGRIKILNAVYLKTVDNEKRRNVAGVG